MEAKYIKLQGKEVFVTSMEMPIEPSDKEYRKTDNLDGYLMDKEMYRRSLQAFDSSFVRVANPEDYTKLITDVYGEMWEDGIYPAPSGLTFEVSDKPQQSTTSGESYFSIRNEFMATLSLPTDNTGKEEKQFYCADWNRCGAICEEQCNKCERAELSEFTIESKPDSKPDFEKMAMEHCLNDTVLGDSIRLGYRTGAMKIWKDHVEPLQAKHKIELSNYAYQMDMAKRERDKAESQLQASEQRYALQEIELSNTKILLEACENALKVRDQKINDLETDYGN